VNCGSSPLGYPGLVSRPLYRLSSARLITDLDDPNIEKYDIDPEINDKKAEKAFIRIIKIFTIE
jgi:hypothetical protein